VVGMMSYSIFVWHAPILRLLRPARSGNLAFVEGSLLSLSAVLIIAAISYRFVEFPTVKDWRSLFLLPPRQAATDASPVAGRPRVEGWTMPPQIERRFLFVFRLFAGWLFLNASLSEVHNPAFVTTHVLPVLSHSGVFHPFFAILANPAVLPMVTFLVAYGHLMIGLSLLVGLMVRVSASFAIVLLLLYWLTGINLPDLNVVGHSQIAAAVLLIYRIVKYAGELLADIHILYCVILGYLIAGRAGHAWGLDAWISRMPFLARHRGLRALVA
jgi:thiosulfate dehydrogenase (quinone) large subunit